MYSLSQPYPEEILENAFFLDIDENFSETCQYIFDNFQVIEHDGGGHYPVYDEKGEKIVKVINSWEEWNNLTNLQKYGKIMCENYDWN